MIIVTGGAGFVGSNLVHGLNGCGRADILVVDRLAAGDKFVNLVDCEIADYLEAEPFMEALHAGRMPGGPPDVVFHQGACTDTTEQDGRYMMENNYEFSKLLLAYCQRAEIPFIYASSGAVYGTGSIFREERQFERPLNVYGYSKFLFDQYVRRALTTARAPVVGLRYFNVYGPREAHKGAMASMVYQLHRQIRATGVARLFRGTNGYGDGEQRRDFVYVDDVVSVNLWFMEHPEQSGIFNVGTGSSRTFNEVARAVIRWHGGGEIEYIAFPEDLRQRYQSHTEADITALREAGYASAFLDVSEGVVRYLDWLDAASG